MKDQNTEILDENSLDTSSSTIKSEEVPILFTGTPEERIAALL